MGRITSFGAAAITAAFTFCPVLPALAAVSQQAYTWKNVKIGGGGGFVPNIVFNPGQKGLAYARTDIGGIYKLNSDDSWTPLLDWVNNAQWNQWGADALATDPTTPGRLYVAAGMYTNSWDPNNGVILRSTDYGATWAQTALPFKVGGNMPGRGSGDVPPLYDSFRAEYLPKRLAVDPNLGSVLFYGARNNNGLLKSTDYGVTWTKISTLPNTGTWVPDPTDTSGYTNTILGISFVTFDSTSSPAGTASKRIFVGVASNGTSNIFQSTDGGSTWSAIAGQQTTYFPHKGVFSPSEKVLYVSYTDGSGPYDGTAGALYKYNITSATWTNISPVQDGSEYYGYGGLAVDLQKPGTLLVATLNSWWPDANIWRSKDSGATWSPLWAWASYPTKYNYYGYDSSLAPWLGGPIDPSDNDDKRIGWMIEGLSIDPFDSNHWLYGTGATIYGSHDLLRWDTAHNVTIKSLADGIEETAVLGLISPPSGPNLLSAVGDIGGFVHNSLTTAPSTAYTNPSYTSTPDIDFAGNKPTNIVRIGNTDDASVHQVALSTDSGATWSQDYGSALGVYGGKVAYSADADTVLWSSSTNGVLVSRYTNTFTAVSSLPSGSIIASDKKNNSIFYAASGSKFYVSTDVGVTFTSPSTLGSSASPVEIAVNLNASGDVWVTSDVGLFHSVDFGKTFSTISGFTAAWGVSLGAPKTTEGYPAVFLAATYLGVTGYFRSDDAGVNFVQINDAAHGFGALSANVISGDPRIYGRVYIGTNGRGIFYGDTAGTAPSSTATGASSTTSKVTTTITTTSKVSATTTTATTTSKGATTTTSTSASATSTSLAAHYAQCGGLGFTGPTVCVSPYVCTYQNDYFSQCL